MLVDYSDVSVVDEDTDGSAFVLAADADGVDLSLVSEADGSVLIDTVLAYTVLLVAFRYSAGARCDTAGDRRPGIWSRKVVI